MIQGRPRITRALCVRTFVATSMEILMASVSCSVHHSSCLSAAPCARHPAKQKSKARPNATRALPSRVPCLAPAPTRAGCGGHVAAGQEALWLRAYLARAEAHVVLGVVHLARRQLVHACLQQHLRRHHAQRRDVVTQLRGRDQRPADQPCTAQSRAVRSRSEVLSRGGRVGACLHSVGATLAPRATQS